MKVFPFFRFIPSLISILFLSGCASLPIPIPGAGPDPYDGLSQDERDALTLRESNMVQVKNAELESYLMNVMGKLFGHELLAKENIRIALVASGDPGAAIFNDGLLVWKIGTFDHLKNEDEVAAILAHEMAHLTSEHHETDMTGAFMDKIMATGETAVIFSGAGSMAELWTAANSVRWASDSLLFPSFSREEETEADIEAAKTLVAAGYNADAVRTMLGRLRVFYGDQTEFVAEKMFALGSDGGSKTSDIRLTIDTDAVMRNLKGYAEAKWGKAYETYVEREAAVRMTLAKDYPKRERGKFKTQQYQDLLASEAVADWFKDHRVGFELARLVIEDQEDVDAFHKAAAYLDNSSVTSEVFNYDSIFKSALRNEQRDVASNIAARLINSDNATLEHYLIYGSYESQLGDPEEAIAVFQIADQTFSRSQDQTIVPLILSAKDKAGIKQGTTALRCLDPTLTAACLSRKKQ